MSALPFAPGSRAVVIGVAGSIGRLLARQMLVSGIDVVGVDLVSGGPLSGVRQILADATRPNKELNEALAQARVVVLAVAQHALLKILRELPPHVPSHCLFVETLSTKSSFAHWLQSERLAQPVLGINPMFSGDLDPVGRPVAVVSYRGASAVALAGMLQSWGLEAVHLDADEHDRAMAMLQAVGHAGLVAFGQALLRSPTGLGSVIKLAPPPFRVMLALLARMTQNHPDVYWEIQADNPYAAEARRDLIAGARALDACIEAHARDDLRSTLMELKEVLIEPHGEYVNAVRRIFEVINLPPTPDAPATLPEFRAAIDRIDDQLVDLLGERLNLIRQVAHAKQASATPVMQPNRVVEVVQRCKARGERWRIRGELIEQLYHLIIEEACHIEYDHLGGPRESLLLSSASAFSTEVNAR